MIAYDSHKHCQPVSRTITGHASQYEVAAELSINVTEVLHLWSILKAHSVNGLYVKFTDNAVYFPHEIVEHLRLLSKSNHSTKTKIAA